MVFTKLPQLSCKLLLCVLKQPNFHLRPTFINILSKEKWDDVVFYWDLSLGCFLSARHPPHLTRLFPHPCIFSFSRQLLDHLLQSRKKNVEIREVIKSKTKTPTAIFALTWQSVCPACPWWSAPTPTCSPSHGSSSRDA